MSEDQRKDKMFSKFIGLVRRNGFRVDMHSAFCKKRIKKRKPCIDCKSKLGCQRLHEVVNLMKASNRAYYNHPELARDFDSTFLFMGAVIETMRKIVSKKVKYDQIKKIIVSMEGEFEL